MQLPSSISCEKVEYIKKGQTPLGLRPGDFILVVADSFYDIFIRFGQRLRLSKKDAQFARYTHAALITDESGALVEAISTGVRQNTLSYYQNHDYLLVRTLASDLDRLETIRFANSCLRDGYGWVTILSIGWTLLTGSKFSIGIDGQEICSGLVARSLERSSAIFPRDPSHISPADLARLYTNAYILVSTQRLTTQTATTA